VRGTECGLRQGSKLDVQTQNSRRKHTHVSRARRRAELRFGEAGPAPSSGSTRHLAAGVDDHQRITGAAATGRFDSDMENVSVEEPGG
jgi:hypothetical protein